MEEDSRLDEPLFEKEDEQKSNWIISDLQWVAQESHEMVWVFSYGLILKEKTQAEQFQLVRYNPLYWLVVLVAFISILSGKWVHSLVGQGGKVRDDETEIEREVRVQWIYATDGPFAISIIFSGIDAIMYGVTNNKAAILGLVLDFFIDLSFIYGNILFLNSLKRKNIARIRVAIFSNAAFALALLILLVLGFILRFNSHWSWNDRATWSARAIAAIFFSLAVFFYAKLWFLHGDRPNSSPTSLLSADAAAKLGMISAALFIWTFLILLFVFSPEFLWAAIAA